MGDTGTVAIVIAIVAIVAIVLWFALIRRGRSSASSAPAAVAAAPSAAAPVAPDPVVAEPDVTEATGKLEVAAVHHGSTGENGDEDPGEWVQIVNTDHHAVDLTGWRLTDEGSKHEYTFPAAVVAAGGSIRVHMWSGDNDANDLYVGRRLRWWNNAGDTAYLYDGAGTLIHTHSYGDAVATA